MRGLLGGYDDEPQGLFGQLQQGVMSPMFLGGAALMSGEGMNGAFNGMRMGAAFQDDKRKRAMAEHEQQAYAGLLDNPELRASLPNGFADVLRAAGPERGYPILAKYADPDRSLDVELQRANLAKTQAETGKLTRVDPMENIIAQMLGNSIGAPASPAMRGPPAAIPQSMPGGGPGVPRLQDAGFGGPEMGGGLLGGGAPTPNVETVKNVPPMGEQPFDASANRMPPPRIPQQQPPPWLQQAQYLPVGSPAPNGAQPGPQQPTAPEQDMVQTPNGLMPREEARRLGNAMLMSPKYSAIGKEFLDAARDDNAPPGFTKPTNNALQERQFNTTEQLARLRGIEQSWKPEYQEVETRLGFKWNSLLDKFSATRKSLTPQQRQQLASYTASRAEALGNLNLYIKEITGAAMTIPEAERIKKAQPNPGEGIFDGDSPIEFDAKMKANIRMSKMALARYNYLTKNGFKGDVDAMSREIPLEGMGNIIQQRTQSLLQQSLSQNPGLTPQDVQPIVQQRLRAEFGI